MCLNHYIYLSEENNIIIKKNMLSWHKIYRYVGNHTGIYQIFMETYFRYHICCKRVKFQRSSMYIVYN